MSSMKLICSSVAAVAMTALVSVSFAQAGEQQSERHREMRARMQYELGITDEQRQQMREIRQNGGSREDAAAVLTDEQRRKMQQWREQNPEKARKMKQHREQQRAHRPDSSKE
jgi:Spy/CpxP family protein refolding chaperone